MVVGIGGADCIDDINVVRSGGMKALFDGALGRHDPSGFADWLTVAP